MQSGIHFHARVRETVLFNKGVDFIASLRKCNLLLEGNNFTIQLAFFTISSTPSLKNIAQISNHSLWLNQFIFIIFYNATLWTDKHEPMPLYPIYICIYLSTCLMVHEYKEPMNELYKCNFHVLIWVGVMWRFLSFGHMDFVNVIWQGVLYNANGLCVQLIFTILSSIGNVVTMIHQALVMWLFG